MDSLTEGPALKRGSSSAISLMVMGLLLVALAVASTGRAQPPTHTVVKGDTLWDICERYYGDPELWPKLWEMNPFITNPHLLEPGDVITLLEYGPIKRPPAVVERPASPPRAKEETQEKRAAGIDVSRMINIESIGFLSIKGVRPWGHIISDESERVILYEGDTVYVAMERKAQTKPGDLFTVYRQTPLHDYPQSSGDRGHLISFLGRIVLKEQLKDRGKKPIREDLYKAEIVENYRGMRVGDPLLPAYPISSCIWPSQPDWGKLKGLEGCRDLRECKFPIVSAKGERRILGRYSVVYLACGHNYGIRRGNIFTIVKKIGDDTRRGPVLPDVKLGHMLILEARADTATGVVLSASSEFSTGAFVKAVPWSEAETVLSALPECSSE